jgi:hypothetical protein
MTPAKNLPAERTPEKAAEPSLRRLLVERDASLYLSGQIISMVGDSSLWLAMGIWVKVLTGSSADAALVWMAFILGGLTGPVTTVLVDRLRVRRLLTVINLVSAADVLLLLLVHGKAEVWLVYPVLFFYGVTYALLNAGTSALMKPMFGNELLPSVNAILSTAKQSMNLIAPVIGAGVYVIVGAGPVIVTDAVSFAVAATALSLMRIRTPPASNSSVERPGAWAVLSAGMQHLMGTPALRRLVLATSIAVLGLGFLEPAEFSVNSEGLHREPAFIGLLFAFQGAGALFGGLYAGRAVRAFGEVRTAAFYLTAMSIGIALMAVPVLPVVMGAFALYGAALTGLVAAQQTQLQRLTPLGIQGRTNGAAGLLTKTPQAFGIAVGSALIGVVGYLALLGLIALLAGSAAALLFATRGEDATGISVP